MGKLGSGKFQLLSILTIFSLILTACSSDESSDLFVPMTAVEYIDGLFDSSTYPQSGDRETSCLFISALRDLSEEMNEEFSDPKSGISRDLFLKYTEQFSRIIVREGENPEFISAFKELNLAFNKIKGKWYFDLKLSEFEKTWCEKPWGEPKLLPNLPDSTMGNDSRVPESKPGLVEKCRLQAPEGGLTYYDRDGTMWTRPFDRICEWVPVR